MKKILTSLFLIFICSNCFCGDLERKFEQILSTQKEYQLKKIKNDPYKMMRFPYDLTDQKIQEMSATKVVLKTHSAILKILTQMEMTRFFHWRVYMQVLRLHILLFTNMSIKNGKKFCIRLFSAGRNSGQMKIIQKKNGILPSSFLTIS